MSETHRAITPILFVCEGESDEAFISEVIKKRKLNGCGVWFLQLSEKPMDQVGASGFGKRLEALLTETGLEACRLVIVMADNDDEPDKKFRDVIDQIKESGELFGIPRTRREIVKPNSIPAGRHVPDIMVLMLPWDSNIGSLETMCYRVGAAKRPALAKCIDTFVKCAKMVNRSTSKLSKSQVRCMLVALWEKNPDVSFKWSWSSSRGPSKQPWPVTHKEFSELVKFLRKVSRKILPVKKPSKNR